jgi:HrpA-like RNA helicase
MIKNLPIFKKRDEILFNFTASQIMLVTGETGCGKSTQVPRLIYEYIRLTNDPGKIICVQPRRLAVKNLWKILSEQIPETDTVGYQIAMKTRIRDSTKIVFMTNGIFLQRLIHNP